MSKYTPPTEETRAVWAIWCEYGGLTSAPSGLTDDHEDEFNRWLEQVKAEAWHEGYGSGRDDQEAETRTNQMHATLNPYRQEPGDQDADLNPSNSMGIDTRRKTDD